MRRTTVVSAGADSDCVECGAGGCGALKIFFSYAPCSGTTAAMLDEAQALMGSGRDVFVADAAQPSAKQRPFDLDQVLKRRPDVAVLENMACPNPAGSRNRTRYQDIEELLRAGIDVYATLRVSDLQNEQARIRALGVEVPPEPVPDYLLYGAAQLEFVDIDPSELVERARAAGREVAAGVLNELRVLALRCVSEYASSACRMPGAASEAGLAARSLVVAVVEAGASPGRVLLEASRLAASSHAELEVVCVRRESHAGNARAEADEMAYESLEGQVEAMNLSLTTLYGDDSGEVVRDYVRTQGASDVVVGRRPISLWRRLVLPLQLPFEERVAEGLADVSVHVVADDAPLASLGTPGRRSSGARGFRWVDVALALAAVVAASLLVRALQAAGFGDATSYLVYLGTFVGMAAATRSYVPSLLTVALGCLAQDFFYIRSYMNLTIDHRASLLLFVAFAVVSVACVLVVVRLGRSADGADRRERRTQALFDLNRSMLYAHGVTEVADLALDSMGRLFGRSVALHLKDPLAETRRAGQSLRERRAPAVHPVAGDLEAEAFGRVTECAIAHWVFMNGESAGSGTDTHSESYIHYVPLGSEGGIEGVLAISDRRPLSMADRSFLDLVANQVAFALERQSLAAKHRGDLHVMRATDIRSDFMSALAGSAGVATDTVHALADALLSVPDDDRAYREALVRSVSEETARARLMIDRMESVFEVPVGSVCDVRTEVCAAVAEVREGLSGKVIDLEPGESVPPIVADAALIRMATKLVLEASTNYVGRRGIVQVGVSSYPDRVSVVIADDRSSEMNAVRAAAFELSTKPGCENELVYDEARARSLREALLDRTTMVEGQQEALAALCRAMHLPEGVARADDGRDGALNRQRILRFDRLEYGLYMAALIVRAHGGTIRQRYRLGGGAVVTLTLPRD